MLLLAWRWAHACVCSCGRGARAPALHFIVPFLSVTSPACCRWLPTTTTAITAAAAAPWPQAACSKHLVIVAELCKSGARAGLLAKSADDVELHYAATNKEWTGKLVQQVCAGGGGDVGIILYT